MSLFEHDVPLALVTVMVQKEVATDAGGPGARITERCPLRFNTMPIYGESSEPFYAKAKCGSGIRLTRHKVPTAVQVEDEKLMFQMIRASFNQRRKTLVNGLNHSPKWSQKNRSPRR